MLVYDRNPFVFTFSRVEILWQDRLTVHSIGVTLLQRIKKVGYINCSVQVFSSFGTDDEDLSKACNAASIAAASQSLHGIVDKGGFEHVQTHEDATRLLDGMRAEVAAGETQHGVETYWTTGQKPMS